MNKTPEISIIFEEMAQLFFNSRIQAGTQPSVGGWWEGSKGHLGAWSIILPRDQIFCPLIAARWPFYRPNFEIWPGNESGREMSWAGRNPLQPRKSDWFGRKTKIQYISNIIPIQHVSNILLYIYWQWSPKTQNWRQEWHQIRWLEEYSRSFQIIYFDFRFIFHSFV